MNQPFSREPIPAFLGKPIATCDSFAEGLIPDPLCSNVEINREKQLLHLLTSTGRPVCKFIYQHRFCQTKGEMICPLARPSTRAELTAG